jgi:hypothetical protein
MTNKRKAPKKLVVVPDKVEPLEKKVEPVHDSDVVLRERALKVALDAKHKLEAESHPAESKLVEWAHAFYKFLKGDAP